MRQGDASIQVAKLGGERGQTGLGRGVSGDRLLQDEQLHATVEVIGLGDRRAWRAQRGGRSRRGGQTQGPDAAGRARRGPARPGRLRAGSAPRGCRSRCSRRSRWPSSGGLTRRAWLPSGACGPPGAASSPASAPGSAARGPSPASLALEEGPFSPDQSRRFRTLHSFSGQAWEKLG